MARVTGKYDVDFERGDGGFTSVFGTFIGTRLKENKERYERQLKASDPKRAYEILSDLMKERRQLVQQMGRAQRDALEAVARSGSRTSVTNIEGGGNKFRTQFQMDLMKLREEDRGEIQKGLQIASLDAIQSSIATQINRLEKLTNENDMRGTIRNFVRGVSEISDVGTGPRRLGVAYRMDQAIRNSDLSPQKKSIARRELAIQTGFTPKSVTIDHKGTVTAGLTLDDYQRIQSIPGDPPQTRTTTQFGQKVELDPESISSAYKPYLDSLDEQIKKARQDYERSQQEYKGLIKGPDYNMATAPLSSRPSALSQSLRKYGRLREVDPSYTRESMAASEEAGKFVLPTPYEQLKSVEGAGGKGPLRLLMSTTENLRQLRGLNFDSQTVEPREERSLDLSDADLTESALDEMLKSVDSPLYKSEDYAGLRDILKRHKYGFDLAKNKKNEEERNRTKIMVANSLADQMNVWEGSLSLEKLKELDKKDRPSTRVADAIRASQSAYEKFLQTRDSEQYRAEISETYNILLNTPAEQRGLVGDAYLNEIERFEAVDPSRRIPEELNFKLQGLMQSADEIAAEDVLGFGYQGELPELPEPRIGRPPPLPGTVDRDLDERKTEEYKEG